MLQLLAFLWGSAIVVAKGIKRVVSLVEQDPSLALHRRDDRVSQEYAIPQM